MSKMQIKSAFNLLKRYLFFVYNIWLLFVNTRCTLWLGPAHMLYSLIFERFKNRFKYVTIIWYPIHKFKRHPFLTVFYNLYLYEFGFWFTTPKQASKQLYCLVNRSTIIIRKVNSNQSTTHWANSLSQDIDVSHLDNFW